MEEKTKKSNSKLGVASLILSIIGCTFLIGAILAIVDLCKKDGTNKILSKISLIVCGVWIVLSIAIGGGSDTNTQPEQQTVIEKETTETVEESEPVTVEVETETEKDEPISSTVEETEKPEEPEEPEETMTMGQKNALSKAYDYLDYSSFSYSGLIKQLEFEGFSTEDATFAVDNCGADWNEQAALKAQAYLDYSSFSRSGLIEQLEFEGFTPEQAEYGVTAVGY